MINLTPPISCLNSLIKFNQLIINVIKYPLPANNQIKLRAQNQNRASIEKFKAKTAA